MTRLVEFSEDRAMRVAINPEMVTTVHERQDGIVDMYMVDREGQVQVKGQFDQVVAALRGEQPEARRLVRFEDASSTARPASVVYIDPAMVTAIDNWGVDDKTVLMLGQDHPVLRHVRGTPDEVARKLGLAVEGEQ